MRFFIVAGVLCLAAVLGGCAMQAPPASRTPDSPQTGSVRTTQQNDPSFNVPVEPFPVSGDQLWSASSVSERAMKLCTNSIDVGEMGQLKIYVPPGEESHFVELRFRRGDTVGKDLPNATELQLLNKPLIAVAIAGGGSAVLEIPLCGQGRAVYTLRHSAGLKWYGSHYRFGPEGVYSTADELFEFTQGTIWSVELALRPSGNMSETGVDYWEFIDE